MSRVVMYGNLEEWKQVIQFYGKERIAEELTQERELDIKTAHFLSTVLDLPITRFRCYSEKPQRKKPVSGNRDNIPCRNS